MGMTADQVKKFVEEDYKDYAILVICDNEHRFYHRTLNCPDIVWDWGNNTFTTININENVVDQFGYPMEITTVSIEEIQFLHAFVDMPKALEFVNQNYTDEKSLAKAKDILQKVKPAAMAPRTLRNGYPWPKSHQVEIQKIE